MTDDDAAALLVELTSPTPDEDRIEAFVRALDAPDVGLRTLGVQGLARTLAATDRPAAAVRAAGALLDRGVPWADRVALARVLARLPDPPADRIAVLRRVAEATDDELRALCRDACDRHAGAHGGGAVDWEGWHRRVTDERDVHGVLPAAWLHYEDDPDAAAAVLRAAFLGGCGGSLYAEGFSEEAILAFLIARDAVDEEVARACAARAAGGADSSLLLVAIRQVPPWPGLADALWTVFETRPQVDPLLLRETLVAAYGGGRAAATALLGRVRACGTPAGVVPALCFLAANGGWEETPALLAEISRLPACRTGEARPEWERAWANLGRRPPDPDDGAVAPGPGFADE